MIHFEPIKPVIIHQETPKGLRTVGLDYTLTGISTGYGQIPYVTKSAGPYILFQTTANRLQNISYFRNNFMRNVAYYQITNPTNMPGQNIRLPLKEYFGTFTKFGNLEIQDEFRDFLIQQFKNTSSRKTFFSKYSYITKETSLEGILHSREGSAAIFLFCVNELGLEVVHKNYTLDLLIQKISNGRT